MSQEPIYTPENANGPAFGLRYPTINRSTFFTCLASRQGSFVLPYEC